MEKKKNKKKTHQRRISSPVVVTSSPCVSPCPCGSILVVLFLSLRFIVVAIIRIKKL
jgi:hypothetical protein